jgi:hypothetical protein
MAVHSEQRRGWQAHLGWLVGQLIVVFAGVSAAFIVENYRDSRNQAAEFHQALSGVIAELNRYEAKNADYAHDITDKINEWKQADRAGHRAIPGYYRIPGATHPPMAAWNTMATSGFSRLIEPKLRLELGYFYSELAGISDNYDRYNQFTEREILPRVKIGPDAFYGADGQILPIFRVQMDLEQEVADDLRKLGVKAHDLQSQLEQLR